MNILSIQYHFMKENYPNREINENDKVACNSVQNSTDDYDLFPKKRSGKQILNKLKENLSKNNLKTNHTLNSQDIVDSSKTPDEEKNLKNFTYNAISKSSSPIEFKRKQIIPKDFQMKFEKKSTSNQTNVIDEKTQASTVKNVKHTKTRKEIDQRKKKPGCLQFIFKCFSYK